MKKTHTLMRRAATAGFLLALSTALFGAGPSGAAETYTFDKSTIVATSTFQYQPTYQDLAYARYAKVGITPIPIP